MQHWDMTQKELTNLVYGMIVGKLSGIACERLILKSNINDLLLSFFYQEMAFCVSTIEIYSSQLTVMVALDQKAHASVSLKSHIFWNIIFDALSQVKFFSFFCTYRQNSIEFCSLQFLSIVFVDSNSKFIGNTNRIYK